MGVLIMRLMFGLLLLIVSASGCSDDPVPAVTPGPVEVPCETSEDCDGGLCLLSLCRACVDDAACIQDDTYGQGATCQEGACVSCVGELGCPCDGGGACSGDLVCQGGLCAECPTGSESCACFRNNTCLDGLRCEGESCALCPLGAEGCACAQDEPACGEGLVCMEEVCAPVECVVGEVGCPCRGEGEEARCDEGLTCSEGGMCAACSSDIEGCPCDEAGECQSDLICDEEDTLCRPPRACADLACVENQICEEAAEGADARCLEVCAEGFEFNPLTGLCEVVVIVDPTPNCTEGAELSILSECEAQRRVCVQGVGTAACGGCVANFIEEGEVCRAARTCADLDCARQSRECTANTEVTDASCAGCQMGFEEIDGQCQPVPVANCTPNDPDSILADCQVRDRVCVEEGNTARCGGCRQGFAEDPDTQLCVRRLCIDLPCAALGRSCGGEPLAQCGGCLPGLINTDPDDPLSQCRELIRCGDINDECAANGQICAPRPGQDAICSEWPCLLPDNTPDFNRAFRVDQNRCTLRECGLACGLTGETGRIHPFTLENSERCICETQPGFFILPGGDFAAKPCDNDGDGWVALTARDAFDSGDPALIENARCALRTIDRVVLENEYRQSMTLKVCEEGLVPEVACSVDSCDRNGLNCQDCNGGRCNPLSNVCQCTLTRFVDLYESVRNDDQQTLDAEGENDAPRYRNDERGRRLRADEINPLTRACVTVTGDYNDNGVRDIVEWQGDDPNADPDINLFMSVAYFVELHEGRFERTLGEEIGRYHIRERSRCEAGFPVQYGDYFDGDYWRDCTRSRDQGYDRRGDNRLIGHDFAQWSCDLPALSCPIPPPLTDLSADGEIPPHGLCEQGVTLPPVDGVWRGMHHASQFKCVEIVDVVPQNRDDQSPHLRLLTDLLGDDGQGAFQMNTCSVACPASDDLACVQDCQGSRCAASSVAAEGNPSSPVIECSPVVRGQVGVGRVGFAGVRYVEQTIGVRGCVDESNPDPNGELSEPWRQMCPGYLTNPDAVVVDANPSDFGKLICGCGFNFGGPNCDVGCTGNFEEGSVHYGGDHEGSACANGYCAVSTEEGGGRLGFWMCGDLSTTSYEQEGPPELSGEGWTLDGEVPSNGVDRTRLCAGEDCGSGFSVH